MEQRYKLDYAVLGQRIKRYRGLAKISQRELGERIHITSNQIAKLETNKTTASLETIINLANALSIDINCLLLSNESEEKSEDYMDLLITSQFKDFNTREKEALLLVINAMKCCKND